MTFEQWLSSPALVIGTLNYLLYTLLPLTMSLSGAWRMAYCVIPICVLGMIMLYKPMKKAYYCTINGIPY
jgi:hypothetical protein